MSSPAILMYHAVDSAEDPMSIRVTPARLRQQLRTLRRLGLQGVSMRELLGPSANRRMVGLTFDDGYADFATVTAPMLAELGFTATVFVVAGRLGGGNEWDPPPRRALMTADEVRTVHEAGFEVGSHGLQHVQLGPLSVDELSREVRGSKEILEDLLDAPVPGFCYPYGVADNPSVVDAVRADYDYACAVAAPTRDRWTLPRFHVDEADHPLRLLAKLALWPVRQRRTAVPA